jgi:SAM-dependent methyltransferase
LKPLERVQKQWTTLGEKDPFWAVLSFPGKQAGGWDQLAFFETGVKEIESAIQTAQRSSEIHFGVAVDFGCGVGRLSQALARRFDRVIGIDIARPMIESAIRLNQFAGRCQYRLNVSPNLAVLGTESADFLYSSITLQHVVPALARTYIKEFFRVARPGAPVIFQLPSKPRSRLWHYAKSAAPVALTNLLWRIRTGSPEAMESYFMTEKDVAALVDQSGGHITSIESNENGPTGWQSRTYFCIRAKAAHPAWT